MSEFLFDDLSESLSPKKRWMDKHRIHVAQNSDDEFIAYKSGTSKSHKAKTEDQAIFGLVQLLKIRLWNEE